MLILAYEEQPLLWTVIAMAFSRKVTPVGGAREDLTKSYSQFSVEMASCRKRHSSWLCRQQIAAAPIRYDKVDIPMTVSIGVTSVLQDEGSLDEALKLADALMYRAKQSGRNCVVSEAIAGPQS